MHLRILATLILSTAFGCTPKVAIQVPAAPAVALNTATIKISSSERRCRALADQVAEQVNAVPGMRVDPQANSTLTIYACSANTLAKGPNMVRASNTALAALRSPEGDMVYLLGSARQRAPANRRRHSLQQSLERQVAADLVEQFAPLPFVVRRRIHSNVQDGSARELHNRAVQAEQRGELSLALAFAREAQALRPNPERARYIAELARRLSRVID